MSDLVRDSRLKTSFPPDTGRGDIPSLTAHLFEEAGNNPNERLIRRKEVWKRQQFIARGAYGSVWLEKCVKGDRIEETRAVKQIMRSKQQMNYDRELESIAKFSHRNVRPQGKGRIAGII